MQKQLEQLETGSPSAFLSPLLPGTEANHPSAPAPFSILRNCVANDISYTSGFSSFNGLRTWFLSNVQISFIKKDPLSRPQSSFQVPLYSFPNQRQLQCRFSSSLHFFTSSHLCGSCQLKLFCVRLSVTSVMSPPTGTGHAVPHPSWPTRHYWIPLVNSYLVTHSLHWALMTWQSSPDFPSNSADCPPPFDHKTLL